jgi:hypothetical protein
MKRALGKFETAANITDVNFPFNIVGILRLEGMPSPDTVRQALDILQERHPFLKVRITQEDGRYFFASGDIPTIPLKVLDREGDGHWVRVAEHELNHRVDSVRGPLLRFTCLVDEGERGEIVMAVHHSIVDGTSSENLFHELLSVCNAIESGEEIEEKVHLSPLPPVEANFPSGFKGFGLKWKILGYFLRQMGDELSYQLRLRGKRKPSINEDALGRILPVRIPETTTTALVRRARKERVTLNSIMSAVMLMSVQKHLYGGDDLPMRYMSMADLRPYLKPPAPPDELGGYISLMRFTIQMHNEDDLWTLTRRINDQIYTAAKGGGKFLFSVMSEQVMRMTFRLRRFRMCTTATSFKGAVRLQQSYGAYKITGLHGFISNFGLGPEYSAQISLFNDELWWDILYLDKDMNHEKAQEIADDMRKIVEGAIAAD